VSAPLVSVVMPCHDGEAFVGATVAHVLALADEAAVAIEVVVVDDGSTDATAALVDALVATDRRVRLVRQRQAGVAAARNTGLAHARGRVIGMLDADDRWTPAVFSVLLPALLAEGAPPVVQGRVRDDWPDVGLGPAYEAVNLGSALFRREVFADVGPFDETFTRLEDMEWSVRSYDHRIPKRRFDDVVLLYVRRPDGLTSTAPRRDPFLARALRSAAKRRAQGVRPLPPGFPTASEYVGVVPPESERRPAPIAGATVR
jgi:glycosyltransferase involved in cell wall biosynthesis